MFNEKLEISKWKNFNLEKLFNITAGKYHSSDEYTTGTTPYISASSNDNGIKERIDLEPEFKGNCIVTGKVGCNCFYQKEDFCATSDVNIFVPQNFKLNRKIGLFLATVINFSENYKWNYGRQCRISDSKKINIKLPVLLNEEGYIMDDKKIYHDNGYIPDFEFIERFIEGVEERERENKRNLRDYLNTQNLKNEKKINFNTKKWKEFYLHKLFKTSMGNGIDSISTTSDNPKYNYVARESNNNGVVGFVDKVEGKEPFPAGSMSLALGGSLGFCFIQKEYFYTAQNVGILQEKEHLSIHTKLFIATLIRNECKIKFQAFGRELNSHFKKDFKLKLPVLMNGDNYVLDKNKKYSDDGYIPDWKYMENYIKSLPYGDKI